MGRTPGGVIPAGGQQVFYKLELKKKTLWDTPGILNIKFHKI